VSTNDPPAVGRNAVAQVTQSFMTAFSDLLVMMNDLPQRGDEVGYHWTLTGADMDQEGRETGPHQRVEKWQIGCDSLICSSQAHF